MFAVVLNNCPFWKMIIDRTYAVSNISMTAGLIFYLNEGVLYHRIAKPLLH